MNSRFLSSVVVCFVLLVGFGWVIADVILQTQYRSITADGIGPLFRLHFEARHIAALLLGHAILAVAFVWIYSCGKEDKPFVGQGIRYGLAVAALVAAPKYLLYYAVQPMPHMLVVWQIVYESIALVLIGIAVAGIYGCKGKAAL